MNAEDLVLNFKKGMANLSKTERRRAIESVRDVIRAAASTTRPAPPTKSNAARAAGPPRS